MHDIRLVADDPEVARCHPVMVQLRSHLGVDQLVAQVRRQRELAGYRLVALYDSDGDPVAVAGFRISECLAWGRHMYVDDLVTDAVARSSGYGEALLEWLETAARVEGCQELHLDSGVQRYAAHRFYLRLGYEIRSHHLSKPL